MRRALYEYVIVGPKSNIAFHQAVMENLRFLKGEIDTHFIDRETTLLEDIKSLMEREEPLGKKISGLSHDKRRVAAISAVAALTQRHYQGRTN